MKRPSESGFLKTVLAYAQVRGWLSAHFRPARTATGWRTPCQGDAKGWPDLVLVRPPRIVVAELKMPGEKPTPDQQRWLTAWRGCVEDVFVWTPRDWQEIEAVLA